MKKALFIVFACVCAASAVMATDILNNTTTEAEARLVNIEGSPWEAGFALTRSWPHLKGYTASGNAVKHLFETMNAVTNYSNPYANGTSYTGTFVNSSVWAIDEDIDGVSERACTIYQKLTKVKTVTGVGDLGDPAFRLQENRVLEYMGETTTGLNIRIWYTWTYLNPSQRATIMALNPTCDEGYTITDKKFDIEKRDNTATFTVQWETNFWNNISGSGTNRVPAVTNTMIYFNYDPNNGDWGTRRRVAKSADGINKELAETALSNIAAENGYVLDRVTKEEKENGEFGISTIQTKIQATTDYHIVRFDAAYGRKSESQKIEWYDQTEAQVVGLYSNCVVNKADMTGAYPASPASHKLDYFYAKSNDNGLWDIERFTWIPRTTGGETWPHSGTTFEDEYVYRVQTKWFGSTNYYQNMTATRLTKYHALETTAWAAVENDPYTHLKGTGVFKIGNDFRWVSVIIRQGTNSPWIPNGTIE